MTELDKTFLEIDENTTLWTLTETSTSIIIQLYQEMIITLYFNKKGEKIQKKD